MKEKIKVLLPEAEVDKKIQELGEQISKDYEGKNIHMICVLKGGVFFTCELAKRISVPVSLDFMSVSSYGNGTTSSGAVRIVKDLDEPLEGKDVLILLTQAIRCIILLRFFIREDQTASRSVHCWTNRNAGQQMLR